MRPAPHLVSYPNPFKIARPVRDVRPLLTFFFCMLVGVAAVVQSSSFPMQEQYSRACGFVFVMVLSHLTIQCTFTRSGTPILDAFSPSNFYPIFFAVYYLFPFLLLVLDPTIEGVRYITIGAALLLAFVSFQFGCINVRSVPRRALVDRLEGRALLCICWASMLAVYFLYYWRLRNGYFYTHANSYEVGTDSVSSLLESFVLQLHLPTILLCGLVVASRSRDRRFARFSLLFFISSSLLIFLATSQFRLFASLLLFGWVGLHLLDAHSLTWRAFLRMVSVAVLCLLAIFVVRASNAGSDLAGSQNQLFDLANGVAQGRFTDMSVIQDAIFSNDPTASRGRAAAPLLFFSDVIDALESPDNSFGHGKTFAHEMREVVPRLLWRDKPVFQSTQILIRQQLGMSSTDNSPHPLLQFYYEFGWAGIAVGFFLMGLGMSRVVRHLHSMFMWMIFAFTWSAVIQVEVGLFLNLLVTIRAAVLIYCAWKTLHFLLAVAAKRTHGRSTAIATAFPPPKHNAAMPLCDPRRIIS